MFILFYVIDLNYVGFSLFELNPNAMNILCVKTPKLCNLYNPFLKSKLRVVVTKSKLRVTISFEIRNKIYS